jgi:ribulose-5-phosphate 4-epimerase/fuculose-1-phosphate aldolase
MERLATTCRVLGVLDATHATFGHVSVRDGDAMLIRGKGRDVVGLRFTDASDIIRVSLEVELIEGRDGLRPPSESFLHSWLYKLRPDVQSVIHMHPQSAVLLTTCGFDVQPIYGAYGRGAGLAVEGLPVYDSSLTIRDDARGQDFAEFVGDRNAVLMRGHGVAVVADSIEEAAVRTLQLKEVADMNYSARLIGSPRTITAAEADEISKMDDPGRKLGSAGGKAGALAMWRYYQDLARATA